MAKADNELADHNGTSPGTGVSEFRSLIIKYLILSGFTTILVFFTLTIGVLFDSVLYMFLGVERNPFLIDIGWANQPTIGLWLSTIVVILMTLKKLI